MTSKNQALGKWGEDQAAQYLTGKGYEIVARNVRNEYGELDLVARLDDVTVFVEVKTRSSQAYGYPEQAITEEKKRHLTEAAETFMQSQGMGESAWRVDVIAVEKRPEGPPEIWHFENAV